MNQAPLYKNLESLENSKINTFSYLQKPFSFKAYIGKALIKTLRSLDKSHLTRGHGFSQFYSYSEYIIFNCFTRPNGRRKTKNFDLEKSSFFFTLESRLAILDKTNDRPNKA